MINIIYILGLRNFFRSEDAPQVQRYRGKEALKYWTYSILKKRNELPTSLNIYENSSEEMSLCIKDYLHVVTYFLFLCVIPIYNIIYQKDIHLFIFQIMTPFQYLNIVYYFYTEPRHIEFKNQLIFLLAILIAISVSVMDSSYGFVFFYFLTFLTILCSVYTFSFFMCHL